MTTTAWISRHIFNCPACLEELLIVGTMDINEFVGTCPVCHAHIEVPIFVHRLQVLRVIEAAETHWLICYLCGEDIGLRVRGEKVIEAEFLGRPFGLCAVCSAKYTPALHDEIQGSQPPLDADVWGEGVAL